VSKLLEILWKEPRRAEFLFLDALLEDLNNRKNPDATILILFDHFENVDCENTYWRYSGKKINEVELWYVFLSTIRNCVSVLGSRRSLTCDVETKESIEEKELTELDTESSQELLEKRGVTDRQVQDKIVSVSGGNPFVIDAICDMKDSGEISLDDVEHLRAVCQKDFRISLIERDCWSSLTGNCSISSFQI
ncbi:MAG: hypothetical protein ACXABK_06715, partial [Candidatus Heimdallarchaeaceae archaeon]